MSVDLRIEGGKIILPDKTVEGAIAIDKGKIKQIGTPTNLPCAEKTINAHGKLVFPGLVDIHVHLRDLELSYKEDFTTGTQAAVVGGVSSVLDMPNTKPVTNSLSALKTKKEIAKKKILCDTGFFSLLPNEIHEIEAIIREGAVGFKIFPHQPHSNFPLTLENLKKAFAKINGRVPLAIHPELSKNGETTINEFLITHSNQQEAKAIAWIGSILTEQDHLHVCHVSAQESLVEIELIRARGHKVTSEVTPHHLFLTQELLFSKKGWVKMLPPLRTNGDVQAMQDAIKKEQIEAIATDHAPHAAHEKMKPFSQVASGTPGLETMLASTLDYALKENLPLNLLGRLLASNPAKIYGLRNKGEITVGKDADLVIIDPKKSQQIDASQFVSKAKFSPFDGYQAQGVPVMTIIRGTIAVQENEILVRPGFGQIIPGPGGSLDEIPL